MNVLISATASAKKGRSEGVGVMRRERASRREERREGGAENGRRAGRRQGGKAALSELMLEISTPTPAGRP